MGVHQWHSSVTAEVIEPFFAESPLERVVSVEGDSAMDQPGAIKRTMLSEGLPPFFGATFKPGILTF
ncbi:MAG TPA: hypothetical protein PKN13_12030 [Accumulibacter sp.]|nr:hypothetical protein [Accumulibacter sp.]HMW18481.1 hypothetical protein [Accumulibacter sp.]HMY06776.1 hypothetical protein [Accumulibacter sp.]HNC18667.1 hypothetical protein [Accumulibacter sp.]HND79352.1 hypothetical protein [Accumulibacter sp.]